MKFFTTTSSTTFTHGVPETTEFGEITQNKGHHAIQGHQFRHQSKYDFQLVINTNLPPILPHLRDIAFDRSKIAIFGYPLAFNPSDRRVLYIISTHDISLKTRCFELHFCCRKYRYIFNHSYAVCHESYRIR